MPRFVQLIVFLSVLSFSKDVQAQCTDDSQCVAKEDLDDLLTIAEELQCLKTSNPTFYTDSITIITDKHGRVYFSGGAPHPYNLRMTWCAFTLNTDTSIEVVVAKAEEKEYGFRLKLKFAGSYLLTDGISKSAQDGVEVGFLWDFLYWHDLNLNVATGFRSVGAGVGYDVTHNFGAYGGYAFSFWTLKSNAQLGLYFGFW